MGFLRGDSAPLDGTVAIPMTFFKEQNVYYLSEQEARNSLRLMKARTRVANRDCFLLPFAQATI